MIGDPKSNSIFSLPSLSESSTLRYVTFTALYVAQGLPGGLMGVAIPAWLVAQGWGAGEVAWFLAIAYFPWSLKLIAGPIMDRFTFLPMGRRRPWVLAAQLGLLTSFTALAFIPDPAKHINWMAAVGFMVNLFASFQDVAVDGLAIDLLPEDQQARANGFMWGGKSIGRALAVGSGGFVLNRLGYSYAIFMVAGFLALIFLCPLLLRERRGERLLPWTFGKASDLAKHLQEKNWRSIVLNTARAIWLPMSRIATIGFFIFFIGDGILEVILPVITVDQLGWDNENYAYICGLSRLIAGFSGMLIVAIVVDRLGHIRSIVFAVIPLMLACLIMGFFPGLWQYPVTMGAFIFCRDLLIVTLTIIFLAISMGLSWQKVAATQFALYMALSNLSDSAGSATAGLLSKFLEYNQFFFVVALGYATLLIFMAFMNMDAHHKHIEALDERTSKEEPVPDISF